MDDSSSAYGISLALPRESDFVKYDEQVMGSTEQRRFKVNQISGGAMSSPGNTRGSCDTFYSTYLNQQTHGVASGQGTEDKKNVSLKIAGGSMSGVLSNQYYRDSVREAQIKDAEFQISVKNGKFNMKKMLKNRAQDIRQEHNQRKIMELDLRKQ